jgi:TonB family protein
MSHGNRILMSILFSSVLILGMTPLPKVAGQNVNGSAPEWPVISPEGEEFRIIMPKAPKDEASKEPYHKMTLSTRAYIVNGEDGSMFVVATLSGIKSVTSTWTETERFNSYVDAFGKWFPKNVPAKDPLLRMDFQRDLVLNGNKGRKYKITIGDLSGVSHLFITRKKFYALVVLNAKKDDKTADRFLSSFVLPEKAAGDQIASRQTAVMPQSGTTVEQLQPSGTGAPPNGADPQIQPTGTAAKPVEGQANGAAATPAATPDAQKGITNGGVLNGKATYLPQPDYPQEARDANVTGGVSVQVVVDEDGNVTEAHAISGNQVLRSAAEAAAQQAKFAPTKVNDQPVKVKGVVTYNFTRP